MSIASWLDETEAKGLDMSQVVLPDDLSHDEAPDETIFFEEINPCGMLCTGNHPFSTVERFGHWYRCRGRDREAGVHATGAEWTMFTRNSDHAIETARSHLARAPRG